MLKSIWLGICNLFGRRVVAAPPTSTLSAATSSVAGQEDEGFLLPETAEGYRRRKAAIEEEVKNLLQRADVFSAQEKVCVPSPEGELERRRLHAESARLRQQARTRWDSLNPNKWDLQEEEKAKIAHQGRILKQTFAEGATVGSGGGVREKIERRLVFYGGMVFVCSMSYSPVFIAGAVHPTGGHYNGPWTEMLPTGEFKPPKVDWVNSSFGQMTDEELRVAEATLKEK